MWCKMVPGEASDLVLLVKYKNWDSLLFTCLPQDVIIATICLKWIQMYFQGVDTLGIPRLSWNCVLPVSGRARLLHVHRAKHSSCCRTATRK